MNHLTAQDVLLTKQFHKKIHFVTIFNILHGNTVYIPLQAKGNFQIQIQQITTQVNNILW